MKRTGFLLALLMFAAMSAMAEDMEVWLKHSSGLIVGCSSENRACHCHLTFISPCIRRMPFTQRHTPECSDEGNQHHPFCGRKDKEGIREMRKEIVFSRWELKGVKH